MTNKALKCSSLMVAAGAIVWCKRKEISCFMNKAKCMLTDELTKLKSSAEDIKQDIEQCITAKPTIVLLYDTTPTQSQCVDEECPTPPTAPCSIEEYKALFESYSPKAGYKIVDIASMCPCDAQKYQSYSDRFELDYLPTVLLVTENDDLVAKIQTPQSICDVKAMLDSNIK